MVDAIYNDGSGDSVVDQSKPLNLFAQQTCIKGTRLVNEKESLPSRSVEDPLYVAEFLEMARAKLLAPFKGTFGGALIQIKTKYFDLPNGGTRFPEFLLAMFSDPWFKANTCIVRCGEGSPSKTFNVALLVQKNVIESRDYRRHLGSKNVVAYPLSSVASLADLFEEELSSVLTVSCAMNDKAMEVWGEEPENESDGE